MKTFLETQTKTETGNRTVLLHAILEENETTYITRVSFVSSECRAYPSHFPYPYKRVVLKRDFNKVLPHGVDSTRIYGKEVLNDSK